LKQGADRTLLKDLPNFVETRLIEGLAATVKILPSFEDAVVDGPLDTQRRTHLDHSLANAHGHLFALPGFMGDSDPIDQGVVQPTCLKMIRQDNEENIATNIFLAQKAARARGRLEQPAEMTSDTEQHGVISFPPDDSLEILLVFDPHQQNLQGPTLVKHPANSIEYDGQRRKLGDGIKETRAILQNPRLQFDGIGDGEAVKHSSRLQMSREVAGLVVPVRGEKKVCRYTRLRPAARCRADPGDHSER